jgi:hypothetical protein
VYFTDATLGFSYVGLSMSRLVLLLARIVAAIGSVDGSFLAEMNQHNIKYVSETSAKVGSRQGFPHPPNPKTTTHTPQSNESIPESQQKSPTAQAVPELGQCVVIDPAKPQRTRCVCIVICNFLLLIGIVLPE